MAGTTDYLPVATGGGANVDSQANFAGSSYQINGFANGIAQPYQANKIWRQSSMVAAALTQFIATALNINVPDDGNLTNLIAWIGNVFAPAGTQANNGSLTLPGGLILKWGTSAALSGGNTGNVSVSFGTPFPNNCFNVQATPDNIGSSSGWAVVTLYAISASASGFTLHWDMANTGASISNTVHGMWFAIGN
jgi:hypothetical protein